MRGGTFELVRKALQTGKRCQTASTNISLSYLTCSKLTLCNLGWSNIKSLGTCFALDKFAMPWSHIDFGLTTLESWQWTDMPQLECLTGAS